MRSDREVGRSGQKIKRLGGLLAVCLCALACASCGPHMENQLSIRPYKQQMPDMAAGMVPTTGRLQTLTLQSSQLAKSPIPITKSNIHDGSIYYGYYCLMCHGEKGDGNGPVGESYNPKPTDLSSRDVTKMTDGQLYAAMLSGIGHDPVMSQTVLPQHRWPLVLYVRTFAAGLGSGQKVKRSKGQKVGGM